MGGHAADLRRNFPRILIVCLPTSSSMPIRELFDWAKFPAEFASAAENCGFEQEVILETEDGAITTWERKGKGPVVYISAGMHGDEPAGPLAVLEMMENGWLPGDFHWLVCPALNPGGLALGIRENREGRDLNRDYLLHQSLEIAAHVRWLSRKPVPSLFVSLHEDWESVGFYFYEINLACEDATRSRRILDSVSPIFPAEPGPEIDGHEVREPGWIFHCAEADLPDSWPEAIWLAKNGCPLSFTFETPSQAKLSERVRAHIAGVKSILTIV